MAANLFSVALPHLTFDELGDLWKKDDTVDVYPCVCWQAGKGDLKGVTIDQVLHPEEFRNGAQSAYEEWHDC